MDLSLRSLLSESEGRMLRPYRVDGIDTVGVLDGEPCSIVFANSSDRRVEIRISVDGTDVNSGKPATLNPRDGTPTWLVASGGIQQLRAWPETTRGGAQFVFTNPADSVAAHTHGDLGALGYVTVAVFRDAAPSAALSLPTYMPDLRSRGATRGGDTFGMTKSTGPGMGAGHQVEQFIGTARGLVKPVLDCIVQLRYRWWDDLVARLMELQVEAPVQHPLGFVPDLGRALADLGTTPRSESSSVAVVEAYPRLTG